MRHVWLVVWVAAGCVNRTGFAPTAQHPLPSTGDSGSDPSLTDVAPSEAEPGEGPWGDVDVLRVPTLALGQHGACALLQSGQVKCWGADYRGQLGIGGSNVGDAALEMAAAVDLGSGFVVASVAVGSSHSCALSAAGAVKCWGSMRGGRLGAYYGWGMPSNRGDDAGEMGEALLAVPLGTGVTALQLSVGDAHTCARVTGGSGVKCWGENNLGQLGLGDTAIRGANLAQMGDALAYVDLGFGAAPAQVSCGSAHCCAWSGSGGIKCWGANNYGQLGLGDTANRGDQGGEMGVALPTVLLASGDNPITVMTGGNFSCALLGGGAVKCWGQNDSGQLGRGTTTAVGVSAAQMVDALTAIDLGTGLVAVELAAGASHACARFDNGSMKCWGRNQVGQLGVGDTANRGDAMGEMGDALPFVDLGPGATVRQIAAGSNFTCAWLVGDTIKCWGANNAGQLGQGDTRARGGSVNEMGTSLPALTLLPAGMSPVVLSAGGEFSCATLADQRAYCWGRNNLGQLGLGSTSRGDAPGEMGAALKPVDLGPGVRAAAIAASASYVCAILSTGDVKCWGDNDRGCLGLPGGDRGDELGDLGAALPTLNLGTGRNAQSIRLWSDNDGYNETCALLDDGSVKCWGWNYYRVAGVANPNVMGDGNLAVDLGSGLTGVALAKGYGHACALLNDQGLKCWGFNAYGGAPGLGYLGLEDTLNRSGDDPAVMGNNLPYVQLGAGRAAASVVGSHGGFFTCAMLDNHDLKCWGEGANGALGQGDTRARGDELLEMGDALPAIALGSGRYAVQVAAGNRHACAVLDDGSVKCWGLNDRGQLGLGDVANRGDGPGEIGDALPALPLGEAAVAVAAGAYFSCAVLISGAIKCWGDNDYGQLGQGHRQAVGGAPGELVALPAVQLE